MNTKDTDTKRMTVVIAGRSYPVKVTPDEARVLPSVEKNLNDSIRKIQLSYKDLDMQDCLSMVLLQLALGDGGNGSSIDEDEISALESNIDTLNSKISQAL